MEHILELLDSSGQNETEQVTALRHHASQILTISQTASSSIIPTTLQDLLLQVIKPLFSQSQHKSLSSTGRKAQFEPPALPNRFGTDSIFDPPPPWKNNWTVPFLKFILQSHLTIPQPDQSKTIENHFHLFIPPLLHMIDDAETTYKAQGCECLTALCTLLLTTQSDILKRTGLADVFIDALKGSFHYLPTLTPEDESITLMRAMYPAYLSVIRARFMLLKIYTADNPPSSNPALTPAQISTETTQRTTYLSTLLRNSLLYGLSHLSTGPENGLSRSPSLTTFLLAQIPIVLREMDIYASAHLQSVVPALVNILRDPFVGSVAPGMLLAAVSSMVGVVRVCWVRVRERWWGEVLRGLVAGWLNVRDEGGGGQLGDVMREMERCVALLADVVGGEFGEVVEKLLEEEPELEGLFAGVKGS